MPPGNVEIRVPQVSGNAVGVQKQCFFVRVSSSGIGGFVKKMNCVTISRQRVCVCVWEWE